MALVRGLIREVAAVAWSGRERKEGNTGCLLWTTGVLSYGSLWEKHPQNSPSEQSHKRGAKAPDNRLVTLQHAAQAVLILQNQQAA